MRALGLTAEGQVQKGIGNSQNQQGIDNQSTQFNQTLKNNQEQFAAKLGLEYSQLNEQQKEFVDQQALQASEFANNLAYKYTALNRQGSGGSPGGGARPAAREPRPEPGARTSRRRLTQARINRVRLKPLWLRAGLPRSEPWTLGAARPIDTFDPSGLGNQFGGMPDYSGGAGAGAVQTDPFAAQGFGTDPSYAIDLFGMDSSWYS